MILICISKMGRFPRFYARPSCLPSSCIYKSRKYSPGVGRTREWIEAMWESCVLCYFASRAALACQSGSVAQIAMSGLSVAPCQMEGGLGRCFGLGFLLGLNFWQSPPLSCPCPGVALLGSPPPKKKPHSCSAFPSSYLLPPISPHKTCKFNA